MVQAVNFAWYTCFKHIMKSPFDNGGEDRDRVYTGLSALFILISLVCLIALLRLNSLAATSTQQVSAENAGPSIDEVTPSDTLGSGSVALPSDGLTLNEGTAVNLYVRGSVSDSNGCADLDHVSIKVYRSSATDGANCVPDKNDCYSATVPKAQFTTDSCSGAGDSDASFETVVPIENFADPTDAGGPYADDTWKVTAMAFDTIGDSGELSADFEIKSLAAFSLSTDALNYGSIDLGATSPQQSVIFTNTGNREVQAYVNADSNLVSNLTGPANIASTAVHYSLTDGFTYGTGDTAIELTQTLLDLALVRQTDDATAPTKPSYFRLKVPNFGVNGTYSNTVTFTAYAPAFVGPAPEVVSMSSTAVPVNSSEMTIDVVGTNFPTDVVGRVNGVDRTTTRTDASHLSILVPASDLSSVGEKVVTVYNPTSGLSSVASVLMVTALTTTCPTSGNNVTISANCQFDSGTYTFYGTLTVNTGVTVTAASNYSNSKVTIIADNIDVEGTISANVKGYGSNAGPGKGYLSVNGDSYGYSGGGGYGGNGGNSAWGEYSYQPGVGGSPYGSITEPTDPGSGGGSGRFGAAGGVGGGAVKIVTAGTLTVNGAVSAVGGGGGGNGASGSGSGGAIWIVAGVLAGSGTVTVNGGSVAWSYSGGGGGGGRAAIYYTTDSSTLISGNKITAEGGTGANQGGAGTVFIKSTTDTNGSLIVSGNNLANQANTTQVTSTNLTFDNVTLKNGANYVIPSGDTLTISPTGALNGGGSRRPSITVNNGAVFNPPTTGSFTLSAVSLVNNGLVNRISDLTLTNATFTQGTTGNFGATLSNLTLGTYGDYKVQGLTGMSLDDLTINSNGTFISELLTTIPIASVTINSGGVMTHTANTTASKTYQLDVSSNSFTVNSGGSVNVDGKGFPNNLGPGKGYLSASGNSYGYSGGGGYGGNGGDSAWGEYSYVPGLGGTTYGSDTGPNDLGSAGGTGRAGAAGGAGGGAIKVTTTGILTVNGAVSAKGVGITGNAGAGSGGSIWMVAGTLGGGGTVTVNGGIVPWSYAGGGGGGGRAAVYYTTDSSTIISGNKITAAGGTGANAGGAGTIVTAAQ